MKYNHSCFSKRKIYLNRYFKETFFYLNLSMKKFSAMNYNNIAYLFFPHPKILKHQN